MSPTHWMVELVRRAGFANSEKLDSNPTHRPAQLWVSIMRVTGASEADLVDLVARHFGSQPAVLAKPDPGILKLVPESLARRHLIVPLRQDNRRLYVASCDPTDMDAEQTLSFVSGRRPVFEIASPRAIEAALGEWYSSDTAMKLALSKINDDVADAIRFVEESKPETVSAAEVETAPVVKLANVLIQEAIAARASDVHIEPRSGGGIVRFRVDGVLRNYMELPRAATDRVISRIKILGGLDIADRLRPQDGRTRVQIHDRSYDIRISTVPTRETEKAVLRILDPGNAHRLNDLLLGAGELRSIRRLLNSANGIVIVTGPTGSGKTTTLYAGIRELVTGDTNIMTVEDPIEYELPGITQIQIDPRRGVTFGSALRAILRQDPDIIFVGEIRDAETAEVAVHASQTGHLVLATLHTNSAVGVVDRLIDLGLKPAAIAATLRGMVAQRLVRRVCPKCAQATNGRLTEREQDLARGFGVSPVVRPLGCDHCDRTGYRGRMPINEVVVMTPALAEAIVKGKTEIELSRLAAATGTRSLRDHVLERVVAGETTLEEVERVLGESAVDTAPVEKRIPHVLVVDDDHSNRLLARALLEKDGLRVTEAVDGANALEILARDEDFSLMVLDLDMPRLSGREVLARIRNGSDGSATIPVVVLTGNIEPDAEIWLMEEGADDYIRKPIEPRMFLARIHAALRRAGVIAGSA